MLNQSKMSALEENARNLNKSITEEITSCEDEKSILTGFENLDRILHLGLHPNLIIIGGGTISGNTSFILQIVDNIAKSERDVLFFSFEMSASELFSKSISRITYELDPDLALTAAEINYDYSVWEKDSELLMNYLEARETYIQNICLHIHIYNALYFLKLEDIRTEIQKFIDNHGTTPVVIIDYIQLLRISVVASSDKQAMDKVIYGLKQILHEFQTPVIGLISLDRGAYGTKTKGKNIQTDSFKESGSIENSVEILLRFNREEPGPTHGIKKIRLDVLKGRSMKDCCSQYYDFYPAYGYFEESQFPVPGSIAE